MKTLTEELKQSQIPKATHKFIDATRRLYLHKPSESELLLNWLLIREKIKSTHSETDIQSCIKQHEITSDEKTKIKRILKAIQEKLTTDIRNDEELINETSISEISKMKDSNFNFVDELGMINLDVLNPKLEKIYEKYRLGNSDLKTKVEILKRKYNESGIKKILDSFEKF
jgi:hypothetical protein